MLVFFIFIIILNKSYLMKQQIFVDNSVLVASCFFKTSISKLLSGLPGFKK